MTERAEHTARRWPCIIKDGRIAPCWALDEALEDPYGRGTKHQGIKIHSMVNMDTLDFSRNLVVVKSGKYSKNGAIMNYCPFCRGKLVERSAPVKNARKTAPSPAPQVKHD
jgi:hypothetical protein